VKEELKDNRLKLNIRYFDPKSVEPIIKSIENDLIFLNEKGIFENKLMNELINKETSNYISSVSVQTKFRDIQGNDAKIQTGFYLIPKNLIKQYKSDNFSKKYFIDWINENHLENYNFGERFYLDIKSKTSKKLGEKGLFKFLTKSTDPLISKTFNRPISLFFTRFLMHTPITPNMMTTVTLLISLLSCYVVLLDGYFYAALGGFLYHMASVIDGCDGELARLKFQFSKLGEWLDGFVDDFKNALFGVAIGIRSYFEFKIQYPKLAEIYFILSCVYGGLYFISKLIQNYQILKSEGSKDILEFKYYFEEEQRNKEINFFSKVVAFFRNLARSDFIAFVAMFFGFFNIFYIGFWILLGFCIGMFILVIAQTTLNNKKVIN
ncbi:MAG: CDP-alcohol phosphatidyltransferase family protein, partial [Spirochaetota bacterium]|nr:CDP-alcohol phosphatidyltransferase family protein [Spirochaetota bacterium]